MCTVEVKRYSKDILKKLNSNEDILDSNNDVFDINVEYGKVHSIFSKSLNIKLDSKIINIIGNVNMNLPFSIEVDDEVLEYIVYNVEIDDEIILNKKTNQIIFSDIGLTINLSDKYYECILNKKEPKIDILQNNIKLLISFIENHNIDNGFQSSNKEILEAIIQNRYSQPDDFYNNINELKKSIVNNTIKEDSFNYFIGRGKGLTPSGDDLFLGLISFLKSSNKDNVSESLYKYLNIYGTKRTTDISLEYLKYGCKGKVGHLINNLCESVKNEETHIIEENLKKVSQKGHTSGIDTILGVLLGMICVIDKEKII